MNINILGAASNFILDVLEVAEEIGFEVTLVNNGFEMKNSLGATIEIEKVNSALPTIIALAKPQNKYLLHQLAISRGFHNWMSLVSPRAKVTSRTQIGSGSFVNSGSVISGGARIGNQVCINRLVGVGHHVVIDDYSFVAPGAQLLGGCHIDQSVYIGANAVIFENVRIGKNSIIGAGSVVTKEVKENCLYFGNPARLIREIDVLPK